MTACRIFTFPVFLAIAGCTSPGTSRVGEVTEACAKRVSQMERALDQAVDALDAAQQANRRNPTQRNQDRVAQRAAEAAAGAAGLAQAQYQQRRSCAP